MADQQWEDPRFAIKAPGQDPEARIRAFVAYRIKQKLDRQNSVANCVNEFNSTMRSVALAAAMQGYWEAETFKQLQSVRAGAKQMSEHRRVNHEQK